MNRMKLPFYLVAMFTLAACTVGPESEPTVRIVSTPIVSDTLPCWTSPASRSIGKSNSPSRRLLVAYGDTRIRTSTLYLFDLSTRSYTPLLSNVEDYGGLKPSPVSPDEHYMWYGVYRDPANTDIFIYSLANGTSQLVPFSSPIYIPRASIDWSADGSCLVLWTHGIVTAYHISDGVMQQRTFAGPDFQFSASPSSDGRWWAGVCDSGVCIRNASGKQVSHDALRLPVDPNTGYGYRVGAVRWSPDGTMLAFAYAQQERLVIDTTRLIFFDKNQIVSYRDIRLAAEDIQWSPDGHRILMASADGHALHLYDVSDKSLTTIPTTLQYSTIAPPVWSSDGTQIAFVASDQSIHVMNSDGTDPTEVPWPSATSVTSPFVRHLSWLP